MLFHKNTNKMKKDNKQKKTVTSFFIKEMNVKEYGYWLHAFYDLKLRPRRVFTPKIGWKKMLAENAAFSNSAIVNIHIIVATVTFQLVLCQKQYDLPHLAYIVQYVAHTPVIFQTFCR